MGEKLCFALLQILLRKKRCCVYPREKQRGKAVLIQLPPCAPWEELLLLAWFSSSFALPLAHSKGRCGVGEGDKLLRFNACEIGKRELAHGRAKADLRLEGHTGHQDSPE